MSDVPFRSSNVVILVLRAFVGHLDDLVFKRVSCVGSLQFTSWPAKSDTHRVSIFLSG